MRRSHGVDVVPGQEFFDPGLLMAIDDGGEGAGQPGVGIDGIEFTGFDQTSQHRPVLSPCIVTREEGVFPVWSDGADGAFDGI